MVLIKHREIFDEVTLQYWHFLQINDKRLVIQHLRNEGLEVYRNFVSDEFAIWLRDNVGYQGIDWSYSIPYDVAKYHGCGLLFLRKQDALLTKLVWG